MKNTEVAKKFIATALRLRQEKSRESVMRENFVSYLRTMFDSDEKWVRDHILGSEYHVHLIRKQREVSGFVDNCIDSIAIEYEKNLHVPGIFDEGYRQVKEYCASLIREGVKIGLVQGVLSDTLSWHVYHVVPTEGLKPSAYQEDNIQLKEIASLDITEASDETAIQLLHFLPKYLGRKQSRTVNASHIAQDFGFDSDYCQKYLKLLEQHVRKRTEARPDYFKMINALWKRFVEQFEPLSEDRSSFISEYYVSIISKLLCANFLSKGSVPFDDKALVQIINGKYFENKGYQNFVEYDYFGWLNETECVHEILPLLKDIQSEFVVYDFDVIPDEDLFGEIMVQMSNRSQRLMLGQELTPNHIASRLTAQVFSKLPQGTHPHFIDMCCGSGSMVVETIKIAISLLKPDMSNQDKYALVTQSITGIDIDPLAVILSKINWIIHVSEVLPSPTEVIIPIYHADSLFLNTPVTQGKIFNEDILRMQMFDKQLDLPVKLISSGNQLLFDRIVDKCYDMIHQTKLDEVAFTAIIDDIVGKTDCDILPSEMESVQKFAYSLYGNMYELNAEGRNGIWAFLIKNSFRPSLVGRHFNDIVSNTPWLALSKIADNPYKQSLYMVSEYYGIKSAGSSFLHTELATVFLLHAIDKYLMDGAPFGCILPHSVLSGKNHEQFRSGKFSVSKSRLKAQFDEIWELPKDTFKNKAIALFGSKSSYKPVSDVKGRHFDTSDEYVAVSWNTYTTGVRTTWSRKNQGSRTVTRNNYHFSEGADMMPRYLFFFDLAEAGSEYSIRKISATGSNHYFLQNMHIGQNFTISECAVRKTLFHPVLLSNVVTPYTIGTPPLSLAPIAKNEDGLWEKLDEVAWAKLSRREQNVLAEITDEFRLLKKNTSADMWLQTVNLRNKLVKQSFSAGKYLVVYGAGGSNTCAAYLALEADNKDIIVDQTLYWEMVDSEEEARFLVGILNNDHLTEYIAAYQPQGLYGRRHIHTLPTMFLPQYDSSNPLHADFANAVEQLMAELQNTLLSSKQDLLNPNVGSISSRRGRIKSIIKSLRSYDEYCRVCDLLFKA